MSDSPSPVRASAREREAEALWKSIAKVERAVLEGALSFYSVHQIIIAALAAAEARGRQQAEQAEPTITLPPDGRTLTLHELVEAYLELIERVQQAEQARDKQLAEKEAMFAEFRDEWYQLCKTQRERAETAEAQSIALTQALKDVRDSGLLSGCIDLAADNGMPARPDCECEGCELDRLIDAALTGAPK